ncbi:hypothetical protein E2C01_003252 [Portunus trituberculatus]|uniref:Uncharacterized protein n=1 Tax=Portunus trituberculatus TaxID=210409 RepID=A0A5B7CN80_PORTR|nr:hypothetical protein [Portunus trituberculatus]
MAASNFGAAMLSGVTHVGQRLPHTPTLRAYIESLPPHLATHLAIPSQLTGHEAAHVHSISRNSLSRSGVLLERKVQRRSGRIQALSAAANPRLRQQGDGTIVAEIRS